MRIRAPHMPHAYAYRYEPPLHESGEALAEHSVRSALGGSGGSDSLESRELRCMHEMQELLPMKELLRIKHVLAPQRLWSCLTLEELFHQLNGVKRRLLGRDCES